MAQFGGAAGDGIEHLQRRHQFAGGVDLDGQAAVAHHLDALGQAFGAIVRLYAAKAQMGNAPRPYGRNSGVTVTDVAIGCTALLESAGIEVFELGAWQSMSGIGRLTPQGGNR